MVEVKYSGGVWRRLIDLLQSQKYWFDQIAAEHDVTAQMAKALDNIPLAGMLTMKELSSRIWCDASNTTGVVDKLEARGFVERRPSADDRRVKHLQLTAAGRRLKKKLTEQLNQAPPAIAALSERDQRELAAILDRALANAHEQLDERGA